VGLLIKRRPRNHLIRKVYKRL